MDETETVTKSSSLTKKPVYISKKMIGSNVT